MLKFFLSMAMFVITAFTANSTKFYDNQTLTVEKKIVGNIMIGYPQQQIRVAIDLRYDYLAIASFLCTTCNTTYSKLYQYSSKTH